MSPLARQLVDFLRTRPPQSAREACAFLGVSQPVFSRLVASLGTQVLTLGKARRTRYAARREIPGVGDRCVLYEIDAAGSSRRAATLHAVGAGGFVVESEVAEIQSAHFQDLPYFLDGMRPAGFLGRRVPKQHPDLDLPADVRHWSADHCLRYLARWGWNTPGAFVIGDETFRLYLKHAKAPPVVVPMARRRHEYPRLAHAALEGAPPGSSAGGEQPKFLVHRAPGPVEVLVKFSPPADDPTTRRHADLLVAEHLAHRVLQAHGRRACRSELVFADGRVFLEVERFDRLPAGGRRGVLSLFALDAEFAGRMKSWSDSAETLASQAVIDQAALGEVQWLELFGGLIANSDMHPANLSFFATGARPEELAPAYDMLPMRYSPRDGQQLRVDFEPPLPSPRDAPHFADARIVACELWRRVAKHDAVSDDFRAIAAQNEAKLAALAGLEKKLPKAQR
ncbi:MAG: type II toxin-antitoxin system HipA family toxin YjjJ [Polyangiaceae bacterium]|nr:type II toxin-antitoxin system HipA family toxin YjjJ [Polyangiaceae bacterium]